MVHLAPDVIEEAMYYFRANMLFRNFQPRGPADNTLLYVTLFIAQCVSKCEKCKDVTEGRKELAKLRSDQAYATPDSANWPLAGFTNKAKSAGEKDTMKAYFKQIRDETVTRIEEKLFNEDGSPNKWWLMFAKRKFLGKSL